MGQKARQEDDSVPSRAYNIAENIDIWEDRNCLVSCRKITVLSTTSTK